MSVASRAILSNFFGEQGRQNHPQYLSGLSRALTVEPSFLNPPWLLEPSLSWTEPFNILNLNYLHFSSQTLSPPPPPQPRFSNLPIIWTNFLFPIYEVQNERDSMKSDLTFRLKILDLRDVLESSVFELSYRRFSSMYSRNKVSQQVTSFTLTYDRAFFFFGGEGPPDRRLASQHQNLPSPASFLTLVWKY